MSAPDKPRGLALWWQAIRPKTLGMAINPVIVGSALAWSGDASITHAQAPLLIVFCAVAIQAGTNLFNDVADHVNGTDDGQRLGPPRATAQGWALPHQVSAAGLSAFLFALLGGMYLAAIGGWVIFFLGLAALTAGYLYSHGPLPVSRTPLGEVVVIAFFGIAAVCGTHYLLTESVPRVAVLFGLIMGLPSAAVLLLNNVRDMHGDARAGRKTLAIVLGLERSRGVYGVLLLAPYVLLVVAVILHMVAPGALLALLTLPPAWRAIATFRHTEPSLAMNPLLARTVKVQGLFAVSVAVGMFLPLHG